MMSGTPPPPSVEEDPWYKWSKTMNGHIEGHSKRLREVERNLNEINKVIFGDPKDPDDNDEPPLIRLIENICWQIINERGCLRYLGVWDADKVYGVGAFVTYAGSGWVAVAECAAGEKPGRGPGWKLMAKGAVT